VDKNIQVKQGTCLSYSFAVTKGVWLRGDLSPHLFTVSIELTAGLHHRGIQCSRKNGCDHLLIA